LVICTSLSLKIFPTQEQEDVLWHLSERCRLLYNFALHERREAWTSSVQKTGFLARFAEFLAYKSRLAGKRVVGISEAGTSRRCCACGKSHRMPLSRRTMELDRPRPEQRGEHDGQVPIA
jgi:hypothetical protein